MISYLIQKYLSVLIWIMVGLGFFPVALSGLPLAEIAPSALFWSGVFSAIYIYRRFNRLNLWPLYENLRLSRWMLIGCLLLTTTVLSRLLKLLL